MVQKKRADRKPFTKKALKKANQTKVSNTPSGPIKSSPKKKLVPSKNKKHDEIEDNEPESFEKAVENARGLPDGAFSDSGDSDVENQDGGGEEAMDTSSPPAATSVKKNAPEKNKKEKFDKGKGAKQLFTTKRKNSGKDQADEEKKPKMEEMTVKERKKTRKMAKSNYVMVSEAKRKWEELRKTNLTPARRQEVSGQLHKIIAGKAKEMIFAHDTSRIIQCLMKYGAQQHKNALFEELKGDVLEMAKNKYAKFFVRKLLKYGTKDQRHHVFKCLYGNVRKLIRHKEAGEIIELAYNDYANLQQRQALIEEFYGPSFALFKTPEQRSLEQIMADNPEKKESILSNIKESLSVLVAKGVVQYSIIHRIFRDYFHYCTDAQRSEMITIVRDSAIHMLHTNEGSEVARICVWHGTSKDRKQQLKSMKSFVVKVAKEEYGHLVLLAIFDCIDDTKMVSKSILQELLNAVNDVANDQFGRKVLLYLLAPRNTKYFHPDITKKLVPGDGNAHSKKSAEQRYKELLDTVSRPLMQYVAEHCEELVTDNAMLVLILCIITKITCDPTEAMIALSKVAAKPYHPSSDTEGEHVIEHTAGNITYKKLIINDKERRAQDKVTFSGILMDILPKGALRSWAACNRGCFLLVNLLELGDADIEAQVRGEMDGLADSLQKMDMKGAQVLYKKLTAKSTSL